MRKALAGALIRLAHKIYPPRVTIESSIGFHAGEHVIALTAVDDYIARRDRLNSLVGY